MVRYAVHVLADQALILLHQESRTFCTMTSVCFVRCVFCTSTRRWGLGFTFHGGPRYARADQKGVGCTKEAFQRLVSTDKT